MTRHACPSPGCETAVDRGLFACKPHWFALPRDLRTTILSTWRRFMRAGAHDRDALAEYREATNEARGVLALKAGRCLIGMPGTSSGHEPCGRPVTVTENADGDPIARCEVGHVFDGRRGTPLRV